MRTCTLVFLLREDEILLAMKKRGFSVGKWNGVGGKVDSTETIIDAAVREVREEIGVALQPSDLQETGSLDFHFTGKTEWDQVIKVFVVKNYSGAEPIETEEMRPQWFKIGDIPYSEMWSDDRIWLPEVLQGQSVRYAFTLSDD